MRYYFYSVLHPAITFLLIDRSDSIGAPHTPILAVRRIEMRFFQPSQRDNFYHVGDLLRRCDVTIDRRPSPKAQRHSITIRYAYIKTKNSAFTTARYCNDTVAHYCRYDCSIDTSKTGATRVDSRLAGNGERRCLAIRNAIATCGKISSLVPLLYPKYNIR